MAPPGLRAQGISGFMGRRLARTIGAPAVTSGDGMGAAQGKPCCQSVYPLNADVQVDLIMTRWNGIPSSGRGWLGFRFWIDGARTAGDEWMRPGRPSRCGGLYGGKERMLSGPGASRDFRRRVSASQRTDWACGATMSDLHSRVPMSAPRPPW